MTKMFTLPTLAVTAAVLLAHPAARAAVVETAGDLAKTKPYYQSSYYLVAGPASPDSTPGADVVTTGQFFATQTGTLAYVQLALGCVSGLNGVSVALVTSNQNIPNETSAPLEEWKLPSVTANCGGVLAKLVSKVQPTITAGQFYFLVVTPAGWDTAVAWFVNSVGAAGAKQSDNGGGTWTGFGSDPAFAVYVTQP
jgi:hypothetical protein